MIRATGAGAGRSVRVVAPDGMIFQKEIAVKSFQIAAAAGLFAASLAGAAFAQDASGAMGAPMGSSSSSSMGTGSSSMGTGSAMAPSADTSAMNSNATAMSSGATVTNTTVTNGPVPDTPENRARYGAPMSRTGRMTKPAGN